LTNFNQSSNIDEYVLLHELLFEFHSVEFHNDCIGEKKLDTILVYVNKYWNLRDQMHQDFMRFLNEEYAFLRAQMHQFVNDGDQAKGQMIVNKLAAIGDMLMRNKK